jgi:hypothetical protein
MDSLETLFVIIPQMVCNGDIVPRSVSSSGFMITLGTGFQAY